MFRRGGGNERVELDIAFDIAFPMAKVEHRDGDASKHIPGNKASTKITLTALNIEQFGALLSFYENKVALQGIIWNINSFDQPAVQLGKDLVKQHS